MRLFVAIEIPSEIRAALTAFVNDLRALAPQAKWVSASNLHVTLKFLGATDRARLSQVEAGLAAIRSTQAATMNDQAMHRLGFPLEGRAFSAHLTLARFSAPGLSPKLQAAIQQNQSRGFGSMTAAEFQLIESKLKPTGAEYTTLQSFPFVSET